MIKNVRLVSGVQHSDSVIPIHVSILFQILFLCRLLDNVEQSSLCCTVGPCWLSILNIAVYSITLLKQKYLLVIGYCFQLLFCFCAHLHSKSSWKNCLYLMVQLGCLVVSDCLWPHGLQHTRPPCPSPTPRVYLNSYPLSRWRHPSISSSVLPFSHLQSFPASGSFPVNQLFPSGGESIGVSASVLPVTIQDCMVAAYFWPFSYEPATGKLSSSRSTKTILISCCQNHHWVFVHLKYSVSLHASNIFRSESLSLFNLTFRIPHSLVLAYLTGLFLSFLLIFSQIRWSHSV